MTTTWNGRTNRPTQDPIGDRYTLTLSGFVATLPRGSCGHLLCAGRDACAYVARHVPRHRKATP